MEIGIKKDFPSPQNILINPSLVKQKDARASA
jgi:hypothetical protein